MLKVIVARFGTQDLCQLTISHFLALQTLKDSSVRINALVTSLRSQIKIERVSVMDSKLSDDAMASLISGFADRISLAGSNGISNILAELGPSCTRSPAALREVLADLSRTHGGLTESSLASLIFFFSDKRNTNDSGSTGLSSALMGSIVTGRNMDNSSLGWNLETVAQVVSEDYSSFDWDAVAQNWDFPDFRIVDANQFRTLIELFRAGAKSTPPLSALTRQWRNSAAQFSLLEALVACPPSIFMVPLDEEEIADAAVALATGPTAAPNPQCWASMDILQRLLHLSDVPSLYRPVRDLFVRCLMSCPEVLFCSLVRLQLHVANTAASQPGGEALASAGRQLKTELMRELIPLFFRPNAHRRVQNGPAALRRLYSISPTTVMAACFEAWRSVAQDSPQVRLAGVFHIINIARLLPSPADAVASLLSGNKDAEYSISIAFVMSDNDFLQLKPWLGEKLTLKGSVAPFAVSLVSYLRKTYTTAKPRGGGVDGPLVSLENISISLQLLDSLDASILSQSVAGSLDRVLSAGTLGENVKSLFEACLTTHPSLRATLLGQNSASSGAPATSADDVEEMATAYFQKIYTSEQSITEVVEMLKRFKTSGNSKENEIFACMVHNLFNEYRFFAKYPEKELRITGILFGTLIQEQLVSSITLGIALRYVLEALRKPPETTSTGKMFKFGMFALEQFKGRLHEWPQYCSHIVQIPHLKEKYAELVAEIELEMSKSQNRVGGSGNSVTSQSSSGGMQARDLVSASSATSVASAASSTQQLTIPATNENPRVAVFGEKLGRAVTDSCDEERVFEAPGDEILDKVQFLVNNLAPANVEKKAQELKEMLDPEYFNWLGHFLVVKRISTQANFHSLYLLFLDSLGDYGKGLVEAILSSVYHNIGKLLRSPKITTSSSERSYLKNLGIWLGQITLARNRPILQVMLDCKELLLQGYETGKLIAVAPFLAKTLEGAKSSKVFRPPNPWLMGILGVFRSVYNVQGLKMNIKFEVEVLCKNLGIRLEDIPLRNEVLALRIAPAKVNNPDFNVKTTATAQKSTGLGNTAKGVPGSSAGLVSPLADGSANSSGTGQEQLETVIPNLASYVTVNSTLVQLIQTQGGATLASLVTPSSFKRWVPIAVDRAIREIIQPVVERSVTIACITTKEIVTKDFAMESDETKLRKAGQLMVANLAGSLALVTCREPLRSSISSHLRQLLTTGLGTNSKLGEQEQNAIEQCVQICSADNLELGCRLIEKAATEKAVRDVDEALAPAINARRTHREQTGQPYFDTSIFASGSQRYPTALPEALRPKQGGLKAEHYQLYESFQRVTRSGGAAGTAGAGSTLPSRVENQGVAKDIQTPQKPSGQQFSAEVLASISTKLDSVVNALLSSAGARSGEVKLAMLPPDHQIRQLLGAIKHVMPNSTAGNTTRPLSSPEQEMVLAFSQGIFKRLYDLSLKEPLRLEVLVALLENINNFCPKLGKDMGTWVTYAPTNNDAQRRLHKTVLLLLLRSRLLSVHELDNFLAARADQGRNHIWVEFSLYLIRTAFVELISTPSDFPKLIDLMTRIVDNRSQANQQVVQAYRKQILRMLEETRSLPDGRDRAPRPPGHAPAPTGSRVSVGESTSLSKESLERLSIAPKLIAEATSGFVSRDPTNARQHVTVLLDGWMRIQADGIRSETSTSQYLQVLEQYGFGKNEEQTERFLRLSITIIVEAVLKSASVEAEKSRAPLNFAFIDMYSRLLHLLFRRVNVSGSQDHVDAQRLGMLNRILGVLVRTMIWHSEKWKVDGKIGPWDQRPWYRLFMNLVVDVNKPNPEFDSIRLGVLSVFGSAFHACQPLVMPGKTITCCVD